MALCLSRLTSDPSLGSHYWFNNCHPCPDNSATDTSNCGSVSLDFNLTRRSNLLLAATVDGSTTSSTASSLCWRAALVSRVWKQNMAHSAAPETNSYGPTTICDSATAILGNHYGDSVQIVLVGDKHSASFLSRWPIDTKPTNFTGDSSVVTHRQSPKRYGVSDRETVGHPELTDRLASTHGRQQALDTLKGTRAVTSTRQYGLTNSVLHLLEEALKAPSRQDNARQV